MMSFQLKLKIVVVFVVVLVFEVGVKESGFKCFFKGIKEREWINIIDSRQFERIGKFKGLGYKLEDIKIEIFFQMVNIYFFFVILYEKGVFIL